MKTTPRWNLPYPELEGDSPDVPVWMEKLATSLDGVAMDDQGALASRPAAGKRGRYYYATDAGVFYRDSGTSWVPVGSAPTAGVVVGEEASPSGTAMTDVPKASLEITVGAPSLLRVNSVWEVHLEGNPSALAWFVMNLDGVDLAPTYKANIAGPSGLNNWEGQVHGVYALPLTAGKHTLKMRWRKIEGIQAQLRPGTRFSYDLVPQ